MEIQHKTLKEIGSRWSQVLWMEPGDDGRILVAGRNAADLQCAYSIGDRVLVFCPSCEGETVVIGRGWTAIVHSGGCEDRDWFENGPVNVLSVPICREHHRKPAADRFELPRCASDSLCQHHGGAADSSGSAGGE